MRSLRIVPDLRSSVIEEMPASQLVLFTSERGDSDATLRMGDRVVRRFTWAGLLRALRDPELELLEVPEPLWLREWVKATRAIALARIWRRLPPGRRRRLTVATYAIENLDAHERLAFPSLASRPVAQAVVSRTATVALGASMRGLDAIVFGTTGAADNYRRAFGRSVARTAHTVLTPRLGECTVCGPAVAAMREPTVLVLGAPSERKGFPVLIDAWERSGGSALGWRLVVADPSGEAEPPVPPGVSFRADPSRHAVHALLRTASVVAMPSVRRPGWREQIGLPLVEGLTHGCRVVTTTETGLAEDLRGHPLVTFTEPGDAASLADGLRRVMALGSPAPDLAGGVAGGGATKRDVVDWWLAVGRR